MTRHLDRLLRPRSIAVIGGGTWCRAVVDQCMKMGFGGQLFPVHPTAQEICGNRAYKALSDIPNQIDAAFVGVNRRITIDIIGQLSRMQAGGAVCFASGFSEAKAEDAEADGMQSALIAAAGDMPILGPNCYGFINALDGALLWPDQHGCRRVEGGVAILTQSSNIAINLTMHRRALPLAYVVTCGNQAQTGQPQIAMALLDDDRVTAIGLHIEGFQDLRDWELLAEKARIKGIPMIALKVGRSGQAQAATISHTASLAGGDAGAQALLDRLGIARVDDLSTFLETLKLLHATGPLPNRRVGSISCSGGEASLIADTAMGLLEFPGLNANQTRNLRAALGPMVALANPLDYNTYIWRDTAAMTRAWAAMMDPSLALTFLIVDYPRGDRCDPSDWDCATEAAIAAKMETGVNVALVATLPELLPEDVAERLLAAGVVPMNGLSEAVAATKTAAWLGRPHVGQPPLLLPTPQQMAVTLSESEAKLRLAKCGADIPLGLTGTRDEIGSLAAKVGFPVAVKATGFSHKTEAGAVALNLMTGDAVIEAAAGMPASAFLVEEMISDSVAELLIGIVKDPAHGFVLTLAAGGTLTEILQDSISLLVPASAASVKSALQSLKITRLIQGYRGKPTADMAAIMAAIESIQSYVVANAASVEEVEVNPLLCTPTRAVVADALIREAP